MIENLFIGNSDNSDGESKTNRNKFFISLIPLLLSLIHSFSTFIDEQNSKNFSGADRWISDQFSSNVNEREKQRKRERGRFDVCSQTEQIKQQHANKNNLKVMYVGNTCNEDVVTKDKIRPRESKRNKR